MSYDTSLGFTRNARALSYGFYGYCMLGRFTHSNEARRTCPYMNIIYNRNRRTGCPVLYQISARLCSVSRALLQHVVAQVTV